MIMIVISFALVKFYAFAILYVLIVMQIELVVVVVVWSGVTFAFSSQNEFLGGKGTSETGGQFPEFLFSIR